MRSILFLLCFVFASVANAQAFISGQSTNAVSAPFWCDNNAAVFDKVWTATTGSGLISADPPVYGAYPDGSDAIGIYHHTTTGNVERMAGSGGGSTLHGMLLWDGNRTIVYEFGARLQDTYLVSGAESTSGLINRISANYTGVSVRFETTTSTTQLFAQTNDGATDTKTFLVGVNPFSWHKFRIVLSKTPRTATIFVDGTQYAVLSTTLPPTTTVISPAVRTARYSATNTYNSYFDYQCVYVYQ